jgi:hypothetical protein
MLDLKAIHVSESYFLGIFGSRVPGYIDIDIRNKPRIL